MKVGTFRMDTAFLHAFDEENRYCCRWGNKKRKSEIAFPSFIFVV